MISIGALYAAGPAMQSDIASLFCYDCAMSLLHISINAQEQEDVARFLARILDGKALPFPPFPDSWIAFTDKNDGTAIEVYPLGHRLKAGPDQIACISGSPDNQETFVHAAIGSPLPCDRILALADSKGWTSRICNRGPFECVEVWIENRLLIEVLDPQMQQAYRSGMTVENWKRMFGMSS